MHLEEFQGKFDGPVSLKIRDVDRDRAYAAVARARARARANDGNEKEPEEEKNYAILCPKCHSAEVVLEGRDSDLAEPPPTAKFQWRCDACGYQWVDDGITQEAAGGQSWPGEEFSSRRGPFRRVDPK
jgi:DNA-directed RNA polymerase subunit M/transcription elongation factor TFIIS